MTTLNDLLAARVGKTAQADDMRKLEGDTGQRIDDPAGFRKALVSEFRKGGQDLHAALVLPRKGEAPGATPGAKRATPWLAAMAPPDSASAEAIKALGQMLIRLSAGGGKPSASEMQSIQVALDWCQAQARRATTSDSDAS
jgi:hypothetical protein